ncbi:alpha/beta hydrolase [Hymenobacter mucosus]|uniref:Acetyl esterase/lipase n=1 Tax=Hymenobacter mucosus TaxID=1411120 RepID=A0A239B8I1_9BACT|nr:alpha/beta hydrolase [Hymenobacter mucosus]SNS03841.1 Acetyl esterase/lipase [Hymenobacter mucosus]
MKHLFALLGLLWFAAAASAQTRIDTTGGRYYKPIFANVTRTQDITYGSSIDYLGGQQALRLDVYQPTGDTVRRRPLLIFAHGGGFISGNKTDQDVTELCTRFARLGYVTASIDYRLLFLPFDTTNISIASFRGVQDMRAAIRFFRMKAATAAVTAADNYRIHPDYIYVGGSSAGAFMALQTAYLNKASEVPSTINLANLGGLEGTGGNPTYSSAVRGVINLSGALGRPTWIEAGDVPFVSMHGTNDPIVPYGAGRVGGGLPPQRIYGSAVLNTRAIAVGVQNPFYTFKRAGHVPFSGTSATAVAYMDTTFRFVRDFLRPLLRQTGTVTAAQRANTQAVLQAYPVPAATVVRLTWSSNMAFHARPVELLDAMGRVVRRFRWEQPELLIPRETLRAGTYLVRPEGLAAQRIIFE